MATPIDLVTAVSEAIKEVTSLFKEWIAGADIRRMKKAVEIGEAIALRIKEKGTEDLVLKKWAEDFFHYNN